MLQGKRLAWGVQLSRATPVIRGFRFRMLYDSDKKEIARKFRARHLQDRRYCNR
jgi:hypothetical protein